MPRPRLSLDRIYLGDCFELLPKVPDASVHMVFADLPYAKTRNKWDTPLDLPALWEELRRVTRGAIILTSVEPFTSTLVTSNLTDFRYRWVWFKVNKCSGHLNAKKQPLRYTEDVLVFATSSPPYFPIMEDGEPYTAVSRGRKSSNYGKQADGVKTVNEGKYYPRDLLVIPGDERGTVGRIHPTQKPVALIEYLIKTYTREGETVLDPTAGSGTTAVAARSCGRCFLCFEKDAEYHAKALERLTAKSYKRKRRK